MRVIVSIEARFLLTRDGSAWTESAFPYSFWRRYLAVFDDVRILARAQLVTNPPLGALRVTGDGVHLAPIPYFVGPRQYLKVRRQVRQALRRAIRAGDAVILRVASTLANDLIPELRRKNHPFALEIVGDPYDTFSAGAVVHPLRTAFRILYTLKLREQCQQAAATAYVTASRLQRRYPPRPGAFTTHYSSIELGEECIAAARPAIRREGPYRLITVGSLDQLYKAPDVLIDAVALVRAEGIDAHLRIVGDGRHRAELEARAKDRGLGDAATFVGVLPAGAAVRAELDRADLFVLPSRCEGLPRALIEAMARGLPAIGSTVGGFPELLPAEDLVEPGDAVALARMIARTLHHPKIRERMSHDNLLKAREYEDSILRERRLAFYQQIQNCTAKSALTRSSY